MKREVCTPPGRSDGPSVSDPPERAGAQEAASRCLASLTCTWCEVCVLMCPDLCITRDPESGHILIDLDHCKGCGLCSQFCPKGAIEMVAELGDG